MLWHPSLTQSVTEQLDRLAPLPSRWPSLELLCEPVWGTRRRPERPTMGPAVALCAAALGKRLMPWQQYVADVITEYDPITGLFYYREWRCSVPRQQGKTTLVVAKSVHRCIGFGSRQAAVYTAQNRTAAANKWREEFIPVLEASPTYRDWFKKRESAGSESVAWINGSFWGVQSVKATSGHGPTLDEGIIDEAFAREDASVEQAMRPAMMTRLLAQLGVLSTAGKADGSAPYWHAKVLDGRARVEADQDRGVAYFEWSAATREDPEGKDVDVLDPATWRRCMPALGYSVTEDIIAADIDGMLGQPNGEDEVARAYCNLWRGSGRSLSPIDGVKWAGCLDEASTVAGAPVWSIDINPEQDSATVGLAGASTSDPAAVHLELLEHRLGPTDWALDVLRFRADRYGTRPVVIDASGPAAKLVKPLRKAGFIVEALQVPELASACMDFVEAVNVGSVTHLGDANLGSAIAGCGKRKLGDRWAFSRGASSTDITSLMAVTLARYGHLTWPEYDADGSIL